VLDVVGHHRQHERDQVRAIAWDLQGREPAFSRRRGGSHVSELRKPSRAIVNASADRFALSGESKSR